MIIASGLSAAAALIIGAVLIFHRWQHWRTQKRMLSFCSRADDGTIYIRNPKTGAEHKFADLMAERIAGKSALSPRQKRRVRRTAKRLAAGRVVPAEAMSPHLGVTFPAGSMTDGATLER